MKKNKFKKNPKMNLTNDMQCVTSHKAAKMLYVTPTTILQWIKKDYLKCIVTLGGHRRIPLEEIKKLQKKMKNK